MNALVSNSSGNANTSVGFAALSSNLTGNNNTAMGWGALGGNASGSENVAIGYLANQGNAGSTNNVAIGSHAAAAGGGGNVVAIGFSALQQNTAGDNVAVGAAALTNNTSGFFNVGVGSRSMVTNTTGSQNVAVGIGALQGLTTGTGNVALGFLAGQNTQQGSGNIAIGWDAGPTVPEVSSSITLGNAALAAAAGAVQIGGGTNQTANTVQFGNWNFLDMNGNGTFASLRAGALSGNGMGVCSGAGGVLVDCPPSVSGGGGTGQYLPLTGGALSGTLDVNGASGSLFAVNVHKGGGVSLYNPGDNQFNLLYTDGQSNLHVAGLNGGPFTSIPSIASA